MRLIDTEKAWETAQRIYSDPVLLHAIKNVLDSTPAMDAVPVVHGRWELESLFVGPWGQTTHKCSVCNDYFTDDAKNLWYCPRCGAVMTEIEEYDRRIGTPRESMVKICKHGRRTDGS